MIMVMCCLLVTFVLNCVVLNHAHGAVCLLFSSLYSANSCGWWCFTHLLVVCEVMFFYLLSNLCRAESYVRWLLRLLVRVMIIFHALGLFVFIQFFSNHAYDDGDYLSAICLLHYLVSSAMMTHIGQTCGQRYADARPLHWANIQPTFMPMHGQCIGPTSSQRFANVWTIHWTNVLPINRPDARPMCQKCIGLVHFANALPMQKPASAQRFANVCWLPG